MLLYLDPATAAHYAAANNGYDAYKGKYKLQNV